jgi:transposase
MGGTSCSSAYLTPLPTAIPEGPSNKPPSSDSPFKDKPKKPKKAKTPKHRKGARQQILRPTEVTELHPGPCVCGCSSLEATEPYYIHQYIEIPEPRLEVEHIILHRGRCSRCGRMVKALIPPEKRSGFGPRLSANIAELCGMHGDSRRAVQDYLLSVFGLPISQGGIQKVIERVCRGIKPHYDAIAEVARSAPVGHVDETTWRRKAKLVWLWVLASSHVALFMIHPNRSKAAFEALIQAWVGVLIADGYGVYRNWAGKRQACLAHLIREAKGLAERKDPAMAKCGAWARDELQRLCHMAKAPPTVGEWRAFFARFKRMLSIYGYRKDDAGKLVRRLKQEMEHLWLFLQESGVAPTNNHAERMLRFAVIWRKRSLGTASEGGDRWVERNLSLRQTCRIQDRRTFPVLVEAMSAAFHDRHPDVGWIRALGATP